MTFTLSRFAAFVVFFILDSKRKVSFLRASTFFVLGAPFLSVTQLRVRSATGRKAAREVRYSAKCTSPAGTLCDVRAFRGAPRGKAPDTAAESTTRAIRRMATKKPHTTCF